MISSTEQVLDHGYVQLIEHWGSDERIIGAARMSTSKGFKGWPEDERLLRYLWIHEHMTPFEMAGAVFEVQAPIFVLREWQRHRTMSYNELSSRYTELPDLCYVPSIERLMNGKQGTVNKQGSAAGFSSLEAEAVRSMVDNTNRYCREVYERFLREGVAREIARLVIPVSQYTRMRVSANLRNWLAFLKLRMDHAAQWEIREYADAVHEQLTELFPRTLALFDFDRE